MKVKGFEFYGKSFNNEILENTFDGDKSINEIQSWLDDNEGIEVISTDIVKTNYCVYYIIMYKESYRVGDFIDDP